LKEPASFGQLPGDPCGSPADPETFEMPPGPEMLGILEGEHNRILFSIPDLKA
jgi:hypothetical protein